MIVLLVVIHSPQIKERLNQGAWSLPPDDWPSEVQTQAHFALAAMSIIRPVKDWVWQNTHGHEREIRRATYFCPARDGQRWEALEISFEKDSDAVAFKLRWNDEVEIETLEQTV